VVRHAIQEAVASGVAVVFQCALPVIVLAFLVSFLLREIPLSDGVNIGSAAIEGMEEAGFGILGEPAPSGMDDGHSDQRDATLATDSFTADSEAPAGQGNATSRAPG
jgi:hypothetical protein